jgi:hypothetical protein
MSLVTTVLVVAWVVCATVCATTPCAMSLLHTRAPYEGNDTVYLATNEPKNHQLIFDTQTKQSSI